MSLGLSFTAGQRVTAAQLQSIVDQVDSLTAPGWTTYTATLTFSNGGASLGNGTLAARYRRASTSDLVVYEGRLTWGSTTSAGSGGFLQISMPFNASATAASIAVAGSAQVLDFGTIRRSANVVLSSASIITFIVNAGDVTNTIPQTFATGDVIAWSITYEPA